MATNFVTSVFPTPQEPPQEPDLTNTTGIAVSGGGSRSLTCAIGQYRALRYLGLLDKVGVISSVSGGTWASASFVYLPSQFSDDDFLGTPTANPGSLTIPLAPFFATAVGLDPDADIEDPIGSGLEAYVKCAQRIHSLVQLRLSEIGLHG